LKSSKNIEGLVFVDGGGPTLSEDEYRMRLFQIDSDFRSFHMNFWNTMILPEKIDENVNKRHFEAWEKTSDKVLIPTYKSIFAWWRNETAYEVAKKVNVPALIAYQSDTSHRGTFSNRDRAYERFSGYFKYGELLSLSGTNGHFFMEESPEALSVPLNKFLSRLVSSRAPE
jgi:hypothetical protein